MNAQVPYLAKLARRAAGPAPLQPGRPLFPGTAYLAGRLLAADDGENLPRGRAGRADPAARAGRADAIATPAGPDRPGLTAVRTGSVSVPRAQLTQAAAAQQTTSAPAGHTAQQMTSAPAGHTAQPTEPRPPGPVPSASAHPPASAARGWPPQAPASVPSWETPVELTRPAELAAAAGQAGTRSTAPPAPLAGSPASWPGQASAATANRDQGPSAAAATTGKIPALPPPALAPRPDEPTEPTGPGLFGSRQQLPGGPGPDRVSIGTIEVTVVPPTRPGAESRPGVQAPRGRPRPASLLAAHGGTSRLRDGLRRWYGIAQG